MAHDVNPEVTLNTKGERLFISCLSFKRLMIRMKHMDRGWANE